MMRRSQTRVSGMITLYGFGPAFGLPDPSPFCMKADILLQLSGLPFMRVAGNLRRAPKGKLPVMVDGDVTVPDSTFIRLHLESRHGVDFDRGLSEERKGACWALEKMLEEQLYWIVVRERWLDQGNFAKGPAAFFRAVPAPLRSLVGALVRRKIAAATRGHGIGRHSEAEQITLAARALDAAAAILGERAYLGGDEPVGADATLGAFLIAGACPVFESQVAKLIGERPTLRAHAQRMRERFFPEAAVRTAA